MTRHIEDQELVAAAESHTDTRALPAALRQHIDACPSCRQRLAEYRTTLALASELPASQWSPLQAQTLVHRVRRATTARRSRRSVWRPALAGATVALVAVVGIQELVQPEPTLESSPGPIAVRSAEEQAHVTPEVGSTEADDQEVAEWIDAYLIDTATEDELIRHIDWVSDEEVFAILASE